MEDNRKWFTPSAELYRTIIDQVVEDYGSPYNQLMRKTNDIDVDYFDNLRSASNTIDENLNSELKDKVLRDFEERADVLLENSGLKNSLVNDIVRETSVVKNKLEDDAYNNYLESLAGELNRYAFNMEIEPRLPKITDTDLQEKFEAAKRVTLRERIMQDNIYDVVAYHNALMDRTWWECRRFVVDRVGRFLLELSKSIRSLKASPMLS